MKRRLLGFGAGAATALVGFYLVLFLMLSIFGLEIGQWGVAAMIAVPMAAAAAVCAWVIRRDAAAVLRGLIVGAVAGSVIAFVAELFVDSLEIAIIGAALVLGVEASLVDPASSDGEPARTNGESAVA